jgi:hypothetical protein
MGLTQWDNVADLFNFSELVANWDALDTHDHTSGKGVQIPAGGLAADAVGTSAIANSAVTTSKIADASITAVKFAAVEAPVDFTFGTGWAATGSGLEEPRYWKDPLGVVALEGVATHAGAFTFNASESTITTLPIGYRPAKHVDFIASAYDGTRYYPVQIRVESDGDVIARAANGRGSDGSAAVTTGPTQISLSGISFRV